MMICRRPQLAVSLFAAVLFVAATAPADDTDAPDRVLMTENPLGAEQARSMQKAWADHLGVDAVIESSIGMQLSLIPPGTFRMGWEERKGEDGPQEVTHSQPYFIGRHEVTQGEWQRVMGPLNKWHREEGAGDRFPMNGINYAEAAEFCRKLTGLDRESGKLPKGYEYRLPTDAELEYACRAGTTTVTYFGDKLSSKQANFDGGQPLNKAEKGPFLNRLVEVGSYPANAWGLHDTYGSLYEWCFDWYHARVKGGVDPVQLLPAPDRPVAKRVKRGGAWKYAGRYCRSANRYYDVPENRSSVVGFRPVLSTLHLDAFHQLPDGKQTDFTQIWTRDGTNTRIWHKKDLKTRNYFLMSGPIHSLPGVSYAVPVTDSSHTTWAYDCLANGRILLQSNPPNQEPGYFLLAPNKGGTPEYERIQCDLATKGILDRIRLSPSETQVCFEFQAADTRPVGGSSSPTKQTGFESDVPGRTLYVADFDAKQRAITNARPFANEDGKPVWYAWPHWSKDESAIVYQADGKLYQYNLASKSTAKVATNDSDDSSEPERVQMTETPLSKAQAQAVQKLWADHLGFKVVAENSIGMELCLIPPGTFRMGDEYGKGWRGHKVATHSQPFFIGRYELTRGEWERVMGSFHGQPKVGVGDRFPRNGVDYAEAAEFCRKLTLLEREDGKLPEGYEYRLPTDAELEYATRAGTLTLTYFGDKLSSRQANFDGAYPLNGAEKGPNLGRTAEVGSYPANAWGLYDTLGNVSEWCLDSYHRKPKGGVDPVQWLPPPERRTPERIVRGGYHSRAGGYCRSANRYYHLAEDGSSLTGFRLALSKLHLDGLNELTDRRHTEFDQAWTRDGTNWRVWNKRNSKVNGYIVMMGNIDHIPGEKHAVAVSDKSHHTRAHTCLTDGRILVRSNPSNQELGYYLMTPSEDGAPKYERIQCDLATKGILDRISLSPSETQVCFEFQIGFGSDVPGRTLYVADFDAKQRAISGARPFANEDGKPIRFAFPRWTEDESAIVYQAGGKLYLYTLDSKSTTRVWDSDDADDQYPHIKRGPK